MSDVHSPIRRRFHADRSGNLGVVFGICLLPLMLAAGIAFDYTRAVETKSSLQNALDAAVLAGAAETRLIGGDSIQVARDVFDANDHGSASSVEFQLADDGVTGWAEVFSQTAFMKIAGKETVAVEVTARAVPVTEPICLLALHPSAPSAVSIFGSDAGVTANNCGLHANSSAAVAVENTSNLASTADFVCAVGGVSGSFGATVEEGCDRVGDPYLDLPVPSVPGCDAQAAKNSSGSADFTPGVYCGGIEITGGRVVFEPGLYVIKDGLFKVAANAIVTGTDVTFYFYGSGARLEFVGGNTTVLTAPRTGPYAGLVFVQNPNAAAGETSRIMGNQETKIVGAGYFPTQSLEIGGTGEFGVASPFMTFVAQKYKLFGNGRIKLNFDPEVAGYAEAAVPQRYLGARLVQ